MVLAQLNNFDHLLWVIGTNHQSFGLLYTGSAQQLKVTRITIKDFITILAQQAHLAGIAFQNGHFDFVGVQQAADNLPKTTKADNDDTRLFVFYIRCERGFFSIELAGKPVLLSAE